MIVCMTGPTGVGKTDTSWALLPLAAPMVFLDCDWFASRVPFSWNDESDLDSVFHAIAVMLRFHVGRRITRFVVPMTVEMALSFRRHRRTLEEIGLPIVTLQLSCSADQLRQRILVRDRLPEQKAAELEAIHEQQLRCSGLVPEFQVVDASFGDERAVAEKIWSLVSRKGDPAG